MPHSINGATMKQTRTITKAFDANGNPIELRQTAYAKAPHNAFKRFGTFNMDTARKIAEVIRDGVTHRVLWFMLSEVNQLNQVIASHTYIAAHLQLRRDSVSRAIKELLDTAVIVKAGKTGTTNVYEINANFAHAMPNSRHAKKITEQGDRAINKRAPKLTVIDGGFPPIVDDTKTVDWIDGKPRSSLKT